MGAMPKGTSTGDSRPKPIKEYRDVPIDQQKNIALWSRPVGAEESQKISAPTPTPSLTERQEDAQSLRARVNIMLDQLRERAIAALDPALPLGMDAVWVLEIDKIILKLKGGA
jgi:tartrate dehydratase beta subunit/fumarate hydratase class I family protein